MLMKKPFASPAGEAKKGILLRFMFRIYYFLSTLVPFSIYTPGATLLPFTRIPSRL